MEGGNSQNFSDLSRSFGAPATKNTTQGIATLSLGLYSPCPLGRNSRKRRADQ